MKKPRKRGFFMPCGQVMLPGLVDPVVPPGSLGFRSGSRSVGSGRSGRSRSVSSGCRCGHGGRSSSRCCFFFFATSSQGSSSDQSSQNERLVHLIFPWGWFEKQFPETVAGLKPTNTNAKISITLRLTRHYSQTIGFCRTLVHSSATVQHSQPWSAHCCKAARAGALSWAKARGGRLRSSAS